MTKLVCVLRQVSALICIQMQICLHLIDFLFLVSNIVLQFSIPRVPLTPKVRTVYVPQIQDTAP